MQLHKATGDYRSKLKMARRARQLEAQSRAESDPSGLTQASIGDEVNFWTPQVIIPCFRESIVLRVLICFPFIRSAVSNVL